MARRSHIEADDVLDLLGERWIVRSVQAAHSMWLETIGVPDALARPQGDPDGAR
jgi:hypothetical protein